MSYYVLTKRQKDGFDRSIRFETSKMGTWVPYVPDYDKWSQHFKDLSEGYV